ncbi:MAG: protein-L-isoaspartate O-methyltransferase, partial [Candidatus Omnitrophica bacterium]|nr:protein-L-isoaspartate O-methyltransferase [Candidatus Omnitrophota bacterium]
MVSAHLVSRGIRYPKVLKAFNTVPRELFVPDNLKEYAYQDSPLSIGSGQTISQPYIVALMTELLDVEIEDKILEVGTGSG